MRKERHVRAKEIAHGWQSGFEPMKLDHNIYKRTTFFFLIKDFFDVNHF